jgi:hypothetical protein
MTSLTFFYQACPVCGRSLRVPVQYFGKTMSCSHCSGEFQAIDQEQRSIAVPENGELYSQRPAGVGAVEDAM